MQRIDYLVIPQTMMLDIAGPMDVFVTANRFLPSSTEPYVNRVVSPFDQPVTLTSGARMMIDATLDDSLSGDTLVVAGGDNDAISALMKDRKVHAFLAAAATRYQRIVSICNGALVLGSAGLLNGRRATTHWEDISLLRECAPQAQVCDDVLYVQDSNIFTSAGVSSGIDLALHLVELDHGRDVALKTARQLVVYLRRPGDQRQFSDLLNAQFLDEPFRMLGDWLQKNLANAITLDDMAAAVHMSRRNFTRLFRDRTGMSASEYFERLRTETVANLLNTTSLGLQQIARRTGFGSEQTLRRLFTRRFGVTPMEYRSRFGARDDSHE